MTEILEEVRQLVPDVLISATWTEVAQLQGIVGRPAAIQDRPPKPNPYPDRCSKRPFDTILGRRNTMAEETESKAVATEEAPPPPKNLVATLSDGTFVRRRTERQRACDQPKKKKICAGHLKRWYGYGDEVKGQFGADVEIYRCERCLTLYLPNESEVPRTGTLAY